MLTLSFTIEFSGTGCSFYIRLYLIIPCYFFFETLQHQLYKSCCYFDHFKSGLSTQMITTYLRIILEPYLY